MTPDNYEYARGGHEEVARSNRQHELLLETVGYCIHPSIRPRIGSDARIADVGTGTGAWLQSLSKELPPTVSLDGFDISDLSFPPKAQIPPNVNLIIADAKQPFPPEYIGAYDLVHLRLLANATARDEWAVMAQHAVSLLKPGGAIQWEEPDLWNARVLRERVDSQTDTLAWLARMWTNTMGEKLLYGFSTLPAIYHRLGLVDVREDVIATDRLPHNRIPCAKVSMESVFGWARIRAHSGIPEALTMQQVDDLEQAVQREFDTGAYVRYDIFIIVGTKPVQ